jgi:hypothetical protein
LRKAATATNRGKLQQLLIEESYNSLLVEESYNRCYLKKVETAAAVAAAS